MTHDSLSYLQEVWFHIPHDYICFLHFVKHNYLYSLTDNKNFEICCNCVIQYVELLHKLDFFTFHKSFTFLPLWWSFLCQCRGSVSTGPRTAAPPGSPPWRLRVRARRRWGSGPPGSRRSTTSSPPDPRRRSPGWPLNLQRINKIIINAGSTKQASGGLLTILSARTRSPAAVNDNDLESLRLSWIAAFEC